MNLLARIQTVYLTWIRQVVNLMMHCYSLNYLIDDPFDVGLGFEYLLFLFMMNRFMFMLTLIQFANAAVHISGSSKLCPTYSSHLFTTTRMALVRVMVR